MPDIILSSEDQTVFGGPSSVNVQVDFGPDGDRGSYIFVGNGKPSLVDIGQTPKIFDMYINLLTSDDEYLFLYQYQSVSGINTWEPLVNLVPNTYSENTSKTFVDGQTSITVPLISIDPSAVGLNARNFNVQHSIVNNDNPVSSSLSVGEIVEVSGIMSLPLTINAIEYDGTSWSNLSGPKTVHILITVV